MTLQNEIQRFFSDVVQIIFPERKPGTEDVKDVPLLVLLFKKNRFNEYLDSGISKKIRSFLGDKEPRLLITGNEDIKNVILSIVNGKNDDSFNFPNAVLDYSFKTFVGITEKNDKIFLLMASEADRHVKVDKDKHQTLILILEGYTIRK